MATAAASTDTDSETGSESSEEDYNYGLPNGMTPLQYFLRIGNAGEIRRTIWWKKPDIYNNTYFILPPAPDGNIVMLKSILVGRAEVDIRDFLNFWHVLNDNHKERRLLVDYLCAIRGIEEMYGETGRLEQQDLQILRKLVSQYTWIFRELLIKKQHRNDPSKFQDVLSSLIKGNLGPTRDKSALAKAMFGFFREPFSAASTVLKKRCGCELAMCSANELINEVTFDCHTMVMRGLVVLYTDWASFELAKVVAYAENQRTFDIEAAARLAVAKSGEMTSPGAELKVSKFQKVFMGKVATAVPHWNKGDRAEILGIIKNNGAGPKNFITQLLQEVGMDKFKILALGKEKFCANCNRSSYTGVERLWGCPRCKKERTRPKARYCDVNCQKAHWIKHKSEAHSVDCCSCCGKKAVPKVQLRRCTRCIKENICHPARYCDERCQKQDWGKHKEQKHSKK